MPIDIERARRDTPAASQLLHFNNAGAALKPAPVVQAQLRHLKDSHEAVAGEVLTSLAGFAPEVLLAVSARVATRTPQRNVNTVTTNVPGPQRPLFLAGRRMLEVFPYVPLGGHVRIGVAIYSYDGGLGFGVTGDYETAPDVGVLCAGIEHGVDALLAAARGGTKTRQRRRAPARSVPVS